MQGADRFTLCPQRVQVPRPRACVLGVEVRPGLDRGVCRLDPREAGVDQLPGAQGAVANRPRTIGRRQPVEIGCVHVSPSARR